MTDLSKYLQIITMISILSLNAVLIAILSVFYIKLVRFMRWEFAVGGFVGSIIGGFVARVALNREDLLFEILKVSLVDGIVPFCIGWIYLLLMLYKIMLYGSLDNRLCIKSFFFGFIIFGVIVALSVVCSHYSINIFLFVNSFLHII